MACVLYEGDNGYAAMVAEVAVDRVAGSVKVARLVVAVDCGPISNPDGVKNQIEGGALQGLSRALGEEVTGTAGSVTRSTGRLPQPRSSFDAPRIESVLIDRPDVRLAVPAPAGVDHDRCGDDRNAIFDATAHACARFIVHRRRA